MSDDNRTRSANARLPEEDYLLIQKIADYNDRSMSSEMRIAIRRHLAEFRRINPEIFKQISQSVSREISPVEF